MLLAGAGGQVKVTAEVRVLVARRRVARVDSEDSIVMVSVVYDVVMGVRSLLSDCNRYAFRRKEGCWAKYKQK